MSLLTKKKNVFEQIAILKTANEMVINRDQLRNQTNSLLGNNTKDPFQFLINLLNIVSGSDSINNAIKNMVSNVSKIDVAYKTKLKEELNNVLGGTKSDGTLPTSFINGIKIHINKLDYNKELFIKENTDEHELYVNDFQKKLQALIKQPNTNLVINNVLTGEFNSSDGNFTFYPLTSNLKYKDFINLLVDELKFNEPKNIITNSFNDLFNGKNLDKETMIMNQQLDMVLDNIIVSVDDDNSYYKFSNGQSEFIEEKIVNNYNFYNQIGSDKIQTTISNSELLASVKKFSSFNSLFFKDVTNKIVSRVPSQDKQSTANGFLAQFLTVYKNNIIKNFILSPQSLLIYNIINNGGGNNLNPIDDIKRNRNVIKCLVKNIYNELMNSLYDMLKRDLLKIVSGVAVLYIKESADKYKKIIQSLFKR